MQTSTHNSTTYGQISSLGLRDKHNNNMCLISLVLFVMEVNGIFPSIHKQENYSLSLLPQKTFIICIYKAMCSSLSLYSLLN